MKKSIGCLALLLAGCLSCCVFLSYGRFRPVNLTNREQISELAEFTIPETATDIHCQAEKGMDFAIWGRFDIPASDLPFVLSRKPDDANVAPHTDFSNVTCRDLPLEWWQPRQLKNARVVEWQVKLKVKSFVVNLIFGEFEQPGVIRVYFFNFEV